MLRCVMSKMRYHAIAGPWAIVSVIATYVPCADSEPYIQVKFGQKQVGIAFLRSSVQHHLASSISLLGYAKLWISADYPH